ncbi:MAG TPA: thioredoxin-dependent thiol peroxidase [Candidatus Kapabacteria bacterium]|jgi:peroxiredoxin Q/BCP
MLNEGDTAPNFSAKDDKGNTVSLKDLRGTKVVLYFYPKDDTSGCTKEACDFRDNLNRIKRKDAVVIGVSPDSEKSHLKFKTKFDLTFPLIVDEDKTLVNLYEVWKEKSMYGRKYMGVERTTFVIDEKGKIAKIFSKVKVPGHVDAVMQALDAIK